MTRERREESEQPSEYVAGPQRQPPSQRGREPTQQPPRQVPQQQPAQQQPVSQQHAAGQPVQLPQEPQPAQSPQGGAPAQPASGQASAQALETAPVPAIDVFETEESVTVLVDLPGCAEDDIHIRAENDQLSFVAERRDSVDEAATAVQRERPMAFQRSVAIPTDADVEGASAQYDAGVCTVRFPKTDRRRQREIGFQ